MHVIFINQLCWTISYTDLIMHPLNLISILFYRFIKGNIFYNFEAGILDLENTDRIRSSTHRCK